MRLDLTPRRSSLRSRLRSRARGRASTAAHFALLAVSLLGSVGCRGAVVGLLGPAGTSAGAPGTADPSDQGEPSATSDDDAGAAAPARPTPFEPLAACAPVLPQRVTRLSDQHLSHAIADLLSVSRPAIETGSLGEAAFLPGKAAAVNASVAVKLREVAEAAAAEAVKANGATVACTGAEAECARAFIDRFAARAFRRPLSAQESAELLAVYQAGREIDGNHQGGVGLVIEAILQSPSFVYQTELGAARADGLYRLTPHELAAKLSFFLTDTVPDSALWAAVSDGRLDTEAGVKAEVDRMLALPAVRANLSRALYRFFDLEGLHGLKKDASLTRFTPAMPAALYAEAAWFIDDVLWNKTGSLKELFTSRRAKLDATAAALYGVAHPGGSQQVEVMLPAAQRAGILTRAGLLAVKAHDKDTSVVFRGLMVARGLLCANPPPPDPSAVALGEELRMTIPTERGRAEARLKLPCQGCHRAFDPVGVTFEMYGPLGEHRTVISTDKGEFPVNAAFELSVADLRGPVADAVELSEKLADSRAARECIVQQVAAYAVGERIAPADVCATGDLAARFEQNNGDLRALIKDIATWPALRTRRMETGP